MRSNLTRLAFGALLVAPSGCSASSATHVDGSLDGVRFDEAYAGFVALPPEAPEIAAIILSNRPDVCGAIAAGHFNLEVFEIYDVRPGTVTIGWDVFGNGREISEGPVALGAPPFEGVTPWPPPAEGSFGFPMVTRTPERCAEGDPFLAPETLETDVDALEASLELDSLSVEAGRATGSFSIGWHGQTLEASFDASLCTDQGDAEFHDCP